MVVVVGSRCLKFLLKGKKLEKAKIRRSSMLSAPVEIFITNATQSLNTNFSWMTINFLRSLTQSDKGILRGQCSTGDAA